MKLWEQWRHYKTRAASWDSRSLDPDINSLKKMLRSIEEDPEVGDRVWKRIRPYLQPLEEPVHYVSSIWAALASAGPKFAFGAACAFALMAGVFFNQATTNSPATPVVETASTTSATIFSEAPSREDPMSVVQASNEGDLLRFITYETPQR